MQGAGDAVHFLRDGLGASGRGVGGAYIALADDFAASFWNPAPSIQSPSAVLGGGLERRNNGLFTFSILGGHLDREMWSAGAVVVTSDVYHIYLLSGGIRSGSLSAGVSIRSYQFGVFGDRGSGLGLDIGVRCAVDLIGAGVVLSAVSRDIGWTEIRWGRTETLAVDRAAWVNRMAVAMEVPLKRGMWSVEVDGELATRRPPNVGETGYWENVGEANISVGLALEWTGVRICAGVQRYAVSGIDARFRPTIGLGIAIGSISLDIALIPSPLGSTYLGGFEVLF